MNIDISALLSSRRSPPNWQFFRFIRYFRSTGTVCEDFFERHNMFQARAAYALSNRRLFVNPLCVQLMNFSTSLQNHWRGKRFNSINRVLRDAFHVRVYKIGLRLDFTCPNRDGTVAVGGCIYCNNASHTPQDYRPRTSITAQLEQGAIAVHKRHKACLLYTSPSPRDRQKSRMPSSA